MKKILTILFVLIGFISRAQLYNPSIHATVSDAMGMSQATPTDGRSMFYVIATATYRNYTSRTEALTYLYLSKYRTGRFPIYIDSAGKTYEYWFRSCTNDTCLVLKSPQPSTSDSALLAPNYRVDTAKTNIRNSIAGKLSTSLNSGQIVVGNFSNVATAVTPGNDVSVTSGGSFSVLNQWKSTGNAATTDLTNFIGTTDNVPLTFKVNGLQAGRIDQLNANVFFGYRSGRLTTAANNSTLGHAALLVNTSGGGNVSIGSQSLFNNTLGSNNTSIGYNSLLNNTIGGSNTVLGANTAGGLSTGYYNTIIGANVTGLAAGLNNNIILADGQGNKRLTVDSFGTSVLPSTTALGLPVGNTTQRPFSPAAGYIRYNTDSSAKETFNGSIWVKDGGGGTAVISLDSSRNAVQFAIKGTPTDSTIILSADSLSKAGAYPVTDRKKVQRNEFSLSMAEMRLLTTPSVGVFYHIKINGIYANFEWNPTSTRADDSVMTFKITAITTGRLERYFEGDIWAEWFGAIPNDGIDDSPAFQKMSDWVVRYSADTSNIDRGPKGAVMRAGAGTFEVHNWLWYKLGNDGINFQYVTLSFRGICKPYDAAGILAGKCTRLHSGVDTSFIIGIQTGAGCSISNIQLSGTIGFPGSGLNGLIQSTDSVWTQNFRLSNDRYSPNALILLDGINSAVPVGHRYPGAPAFWYNNNQGVGSSVTDIHDVALESCIIGIANSMAPGITNGDNATLKHAYMHSLRSAWVSANTQSRGNTISDVYSIGPIGTFINCVEYSSQSGTPPDVMNCSINQVKYLYNTSTQFAGMSFINTYCESLWSLGKSSGNFPISFDNCKLNFDLSSTFHAPTLSEGGPLSFKGGFIAYYDNAIAQGFVFNNQIVSFDGTDIHGGVPVNLTATASPGIVNINNVSNFNLIKGTTITVNGYTKGNIASFINTGMQPEQTVQDQGRGVYKMVGEDKTEYLATESHQLVFDSVNYTAYFRATTPILFDIGQFLTTNTNVDYSNDIYSATKTSLGFVSAISGDTIKLAYTTFGLNPATTYNIFICRQPQLLSRFLGNATSGNDTIKSVIIDAGTWGYPAVGSYIKAPSIIPSGTRVAAVGVGYVVLTQAAAATKGRIQFEDAHMVGEFYSGHYDTADVNNLFYKGDRVYPIDLYDGLGDDSTLAYYLCVSGGIPGGANAPIFQGIRAVPSDIARQTVSNVFTATNRFTAQTFIGTATAALPFQNENYLLAEATASGQENTLAAFGSTSASAGAGFTVYNKSSGNWFQNFLSLNVHGSSFAGTSYLTGSNAGLALLLAQGNDVTRMAVGTFNSVPLQLFSNNLERVTVFGNGNIGIGSTTDGSNGILQVTGRSRFSDTGSLAARFSYGSNIHGSFTQYSLIDKAYADSAYGSSTSDTLKLSFAGTGERPFYAHIDTLFGKTIKGSNSVSVATGSDSTINVKLVNDTAIGTAASYYYGTSTGGSAGRLGYYALPTANNIYTSDGTLTANRSVSGASFDMAFGTSGSKFNTLQLNSAQGIILHGTTNIVMDGGPVFIIGVSTDADRTVGVKEYYVNVIGITANRVVTLPAGPTAGRVCVIRNSNTTVNTWSFSPSILDGAGNTITTLVNGTVYSLIYDGTNWIKTN